MSEKIHQLSTLYLYLTDRCNLNCRHCWINPSIESRTEEMELKLLTDILEQAHSLGMRSLKVTGGEPLLYDSFIGLMEYLKMKRWDLFLHMETNATMVDKKTAAAMKEAGMKFVSLSLDGADPSTHDNLRGRKGYFDRALDGARAMIRSGIDVQIITSVHRGNACQLEDIARLAETIGAESIKANFITPMGRGAKMAEDGELLSIEEMLRLNGRIEGEYRKRFKIRFLSSLPMAFSCSDRLFTGKLNSCRIKGLIGILASGKVSICGIGQEVKDLVLGDGRRDSLKDIWQKSEILRRIRDDLPSRLEGVCGICIFKNRCLGHCAAQTYHDTRSFTAAFRLCQEAFDRGLFPKSRILPCAMGTGTR